MICPHCGADTQQVYIHGLHRDTTMARDVAVAYLRRLLDEIETLRGLGAGDPERECAECVERLYKERVKGALLLGEALGM